MAADDAGDAAALMNVRFQGNNGNDADVARCLLMTDSGPLAPASLIIAHGSLVQKAALGRTMSGSEFVAKREEISRGPTSIQNPRREVQGGKHTSHNIP